MAMAATRAADEPVRIALWAVPRSVSTAFERVFVERDDAMVLHEPFSHAYYFGEERRSDRYADQPPVPDRTFEAVREQVLEVDDAPIVFMKDMAYQASPLDDLAFYGRFRNTFIIREPREALASLARKWPQFTAEEAGYEEQGRLFDLVTAELGQPPVVVDATDLRRRPQQTIEAYCSAVGIPHRADALQWQARPVDIWQDWAGWHDDAEQSQGIEPPTPAPAEPLPPQLEAVVEQCRPVYQRLHAARLAV
ncbi:MAG: hypothetical protein R3349_02375 [Geminicoccaceae bacterium]|nr:hypothetical protein [Geminicoccaceae bacterium]